MMKMLKFQFKFKNFHQIININIKQINMANNIIYKCAVTYYKF